MRQRFLAEFDELWFDCLNGDSRATGKLTPDGKPDPSIFSTQYNREGIRVGTTIGLMVRKPGHNGQATVRFRQFWGATKRQDLLDNLSGTADNPYQAANPDRSNRYSFRPSSVSMSYSHWPSVADLCSVKPMLGLNDNRGQATHDTLQEEISRRMRAYYDPATSFEDVAVLHKGLTTDAASFDARATRARLQKQSGFDEKNIQRFWFKPFDLRWAYLERTANLWNRIRPELIDQIWPGNEFLLVRSIAPKSPDGAAFFHGRFVSDQHVLHSDAYFIPFRIAPKQRGSNAGQSALFGASLPDTSPTANLSAEARTYLARLGFPNPDTDVEVAGLLWLHALAIGYSDAYLIENADGIRQDWPRIPLPDSGDALLASASLGREIAALLDTATDVSGVTKGSIRADLRLIGPIHHVGGRQLNPEAGELDVAAGWGHGGKGGVTMPGRGKAIEREYTPLELAAVAEGATALGMTLDDALACLGGTTRDVYLNGVAYWANIPAKVWEYTIGGYQVMKKWLSYRERPLLGRSLTVDEVREVTQMARRIAAILLLAPALDANYLAVT